MLFLGSPRTFVRGFFVFDLDVGQKTLRTQTVKIRITFTV